MIINVLIKAHAFAEEKLADKVFSQSPHYGIVGPEVMEPLARWRNQTLAVSYQEDTTVKQFQEGIDINIWGFPAQQLLIRPRFSFEYKNERFEIDNPDAVFLNLIEKHLDPERTGSITVCYLVCHDAGRIKTTECVLRYYVYSHESGKHNEPHVHVCDTANEHKASVRIADGKVIAGKLPGRLERIAKNEILSKQDFYYDCWNTLTDGLRVDINHHFGYIEY